MKARLVSIQLQFEIMADDGTLLQHVKTNSLVITPDKVATIPQVVGDVIMQVQEQLDAQTPTAPGDESERG